VPTANKPLQRLNAGAARSGAAVVRSRVRSAFTAERQVVGQSDG
jgi:hypothetical protein